jgi:membrane protein DedA with SNARE-associated domain
LACGLIAVLNLVRATRPEDTTITWMAFVASLCWAAVAVGFGLAIGNVMDPRVMWHLITALALTIFSLQTAFRHAQTQQ